MDKHEQKAREITENWWHESWKHYGPDVLNEAIAEALRDTSRDAKAEVLREMMEPSEEALAAAHEAVRSAMRRPPTTKGRVMTEWRDIETAPRDGRTILLSNGYELAAAYWSESLWPDADRKNSCWTISDWHNDPIHLRGGYRAKFWMPLPDPPKPDEVNG